MEERRTTATPLPVHSYDPVNRRVLCGAGQQTGSTKHPAGVTCPTCRALLRGAPATSAAVDAAPPT